MNTRERRNEMIKRLMVVAVVLAMLSGGITWAQEEAVVAEFAVRPLGFVSLVAGSTAFLVTLPFSMVVGGTGTMAEVLVKRPYQFTFQRDMGDGLVFSDHDTEDR